MLLMRSSIDQTHLYGNNEFEDMSTKTSKTKWKEKNYEQNIQELWASCENCSLMYNGHTKGRRKGKRNRKKNRCGNNNGCEFSKTSDRYQTTDPESQITPSRINAKKSLCRHIILYFRNSKMKRKSWKNPEGRGKQHAYRGIR